MHVTFQESNENDENKLNNDTVERIEIGWHLVLYSMETSRARCNANEILEFWTYSMIHQLNVQSSFLEGTYMKFP